MNRTLRATVTTGIAAMGAAAALALAPSAFADHDEVGHAVGDAGQYVIGSTGDAVQWGIGSTGDLTQFGIGGLGDLGQFAIGGTGDAIQGGIGGLFGG